MCQVEYKYFSKYQRSWLSSLTFFLGILGTTTLIEEYRDMKKRQKNNVLQKHISDTKVTIETKRFYIFFSSFDFCLQRFFLVMKRHIYWHQSRCRNLMNQYQNVQKWVHQCHLMCPVVTRGMRRDTSACTTAAVRTINILCTWTSISTWLTWKYNLTPVLDRCILLPRIITGDCIVTN